MFALLVVLHAAQTTEYTVGRVCYERTHYICPDLEKEEPEPVPPELGIVIHVNPLIYARPSNATDALAQVKGDLILIYVADDMTGTGQDVFDLATLPDNVQVIVPGPLRTEEKPAKILSKFVTGFAKLAHAGKARDRGALANVLRAVSPSLYSYKPQSKGHPRALIDQWMAQEIHFTASSDVYSKVRELYLEVIRPHFHAEIHVPFAAMPGWFGAVENPENFKCDYMLATAGIFSKELIPGGQKLTFNDLCAIALPTNEGTLLPMKFTSQGWNFGDCMGYGTDCVVPYDQVTGQLSYLIYSQEDADLSLLVVTEGNEPINIKGLNVTIQTDLSTGPPGYPVFDLAQILAEKPAPKLSVTFDPQWDTKVSNTPEIILEAADPNTIEVKGQPEKTSIKKTSIADRPAKPAPGGNGGGDDPKNPDTGLIVGIVVAVVAVIAIVVVIVVVVVLKKKKAPVQAESTHGVGHDSNGAEHDTPDQPKADADQPAPECQLTLDLETHSDSDTNKALARQVGDSGLKIPRISAEYSLRQTVRVSCISRIIFDSGAFYRCFLQQSTGLRAMGTLYATHKNVGLVASEIIENYR